MKLTPKQKQLVKEYIQKLKEDSQFNLNKSVKYSNNLLYPIIMNLTADGRIEMNQKSDIGNKNNTIVIDSNDITKFCSILKKLDGVSFEK